MSTTRKLDSSLSAAAHEVPTGMLLQLDDDSRSAEGQDSKVVEHTMNAEKKLSDSFAAWANIVSETANREMSETANREMSETDDNDDMAEDHIGSTDFERCPPRSRTDGGNDSQNVETVTTEKVKLCGYLEKMGDKGLLRTYKTRWFVFDNQRCRLYYYRSPQDLLPLGSINVATATLNFEVVSHSSSNVGQFYISTSDRTYQLQAKDHHTMMFWLQELQERRRAYSQQRTSLTREQAKDHASPTSVLPHSGLVNTQRIKEKSGDPFKGLPPILGPVEPPTHTVGESTAHSIHQSGMFNLSLTNLKTEIRNQISHLGLRRAASDQTSLITSDSSCQPIKRPTTLDTAISSDLSQPACQPNATRGNVRTSLIRKLGRGFSNTDIPSPTAVWFEDNAPTPFYECEQCQKFHSQVTSLREELDLVLNEAQANQEVVKVLYKQLTATQMEHSTSDAFQQCKTDQEKLLILSRKNKQLIQLEQLLQEMKNDRDNVKEQLRVKELEVSELTEQMAMLKEMIEAKDEIVMSLTSRVHDLEQTEPINLTTKPSVTPVTPVTKSHHDIEDHPTSTTEPPAVEYDKLKDTCQAFKTQNKFLNTEILELNQIRADDLRRERILYEQVSDLEAQFYKTQSKYLLLLNEIKMPKRGSGSSVAETDDLISRMIEEAIESDVDTKDLSLDQDTDNGGYDRYGFMQQLESSGEDVSPLASRAAVAKRRSDQIQSMRSDLGISVSIKWENYLVQHGDRELTRTPELKNLVRQGIPHEYRPRMWKEIIEWRVRKDKELTGPGYYDKLIKSEKFKMNPATKQIELDLLRTLPTNKNFDNIGSKGISQLRQVLKAYSVHNPAIGYCQGLNRLAAIGLLYLNEEDAFWCLVVIIEYIMPAEYYSTTLIGSQTDQRVFKDLLSEKLPRLNAHLDNFGVDLSLVTFNWFLTVFCDNIPAETMVRIWDTFLYEGNKVLFRFALACFKFCEVELLQLHDYIIIFTFLRKMPSKMTDIHRLSQIAFNELNPFPRRHINAKRAIHRAQVKQQLDELERMREEFVPRHEPSTEGANSDDEDDYDTVEALGGGTS